MTAQLGRWQDSVNIYEQRIMIQLLLSNWPFIQFPLQGTPMHI